MSKLSLNYKYYVYIAYGLNNEVLYVGQGKGARWQHCVSGASSNAAINRYYFLNGERDCIKVKIPQRFKYRSLSLKRELELIEKYLPSCNKVGVTTAKTDNMSELNSFYTELKLKFKKLDEETGRVKLLKWVDKTRDFVRAIGYNRLSECVVLSPLNVKMYGDNNKVISQYYRAVISRNSAPLEVTELFETDMLNKGEYRVRLKIKET